MPKVEALKDTNDPNVYETWDLRFLKDIIVSFTRHDIKQTSLQRLARFLNYYMYDAEGSKFHLGKVIKKAAANSPTGGAAFDYEKEGKSMCGALSFLNPHIIEDLMQTKGCPVNITSFRGVLWKILGNLSSLVERFVKEGGLGANKDFWLQEPIGEPGDDKPGSKVRRIASGRGHDRPEGGVVTGADKGIKPAKRSKG